MQVQVIHFLPAMIVAVDDQPVAIDGNAFLASKIPRHHKEMTDQGFIVIGDIIGGCNHFIGHNQDVYGCTGMDITKGRDAIILIHDVGRQLARNDFFEQRSHGLSPQYW